MRHAIAVALIFLLAVVISAQGRDFSGRWTIDVDKTAAANPKTDTWLPASHDLTIAMDAKTITVLSTTRGGLVKNTYNLDGSESKNTSAVSVGPGGHEPPPVVSTAKWQADVLVVTTKLYSTNATEKYSLDGVSLRFEFSNPQMNPSSWIIIYKRGQ